MKKVNDIFKSGGRVQMEMFKTGSKVRTILHHGTDLEAAEEILSSYRYLLQTSPITTKGPGVDFEVQLTDVIFETNILEHSYDIIGIGVII